MIASGIEWVDRHKESIRAFSLHRKSNLDALLAHLNLPKFLTEWRNPIHFLLLFCVVLTVSLIFARTRSISLFSLHPVLMTVGVFGFLAEGLIAQRNRMLYEFLAPIMMGSRKRKLRGLHVGLQMIGTVFLFTGMMFILVHKIEIGKTIIPMSLHSIVGTVALFLVVVQASSGNTKANSLMVSNVKILRWHGETGLLAFDLLVITCALGVLSFLDLTSPLTYMLIVMMSLAWAVLNAQMSMKRADLLDEGEDEGLAGSHDEEEGRSL